MTLGITTTTILSNTAAAASGTTAIADCAAVDGSSVVALGIEAVMTFNASATAGATIKVFTSADGTNYCTVPTQEYDVAVSAGATVRHSFTVLPGHKAYKVVVANLDTAQSITGISVNAEPQVLS